MERKKTVTEDLVIKVGDLKVSARVVDGKCEIAAITQAGRRDHNALIGVAPELLPQLASALREIWDVIKPQPVPTSAGSQGPYR